MASKGFSTINTGLSNLPMEVKEPAVYAELVKLYNATKIIAQALDVYTGIGSFTQNDWAQVGTAGILVQNHTKFYPICAETSISAGQLVTLFDDAGVTKAMLSFANSASIRRCHGFATGNSVAGNRMEVVLQGLYPFAAGLTAGQRYYLSNSTYGAFTATSPSGSGNIRQGIGYAISSSAMYFNPDVDPLTLA